MEQEDTAVIQTQTKSTFVNVLAWISIVIAGFMVFTSAIQNVVVSMMPTPNFDEMPGEAFAMLPPMMQFMFSHLKTIVFLVLIVALIFLVFSIGLLIRKEWARKAFIGLLVFGILSSLFPVFFHHAITPDFSNMPQHPSAPNLESFTTMFTMVSILMAILITALYIWLIKKLTSKDIKAEFS